MRATIQTENPDALPEELVVSVTERTRHETADETFVTISGIEGIGVLATGDGVRIWLGTDADGMLSTDDEDTYFDFGGEDDGFTAELVASCEGDTEIT